MGASGHQQVIRPLLLVGFLSCISLGLFVQFCGIGAWVDGKTLDAQTHLLRRLFPVPVARDVVIVGIDEADTQYFNEPMTLWHRHWGDFLRAAVEGHAAAVGMDVVLPDRSYDAIVPGNDAALMTSILVARKSMPVVLAVTVDHEGRPRILYRKFELVAGAQGTGFALFPRDSDSVIRRFDEQLAIDGTSVPTLAGQLARGLGLKPQPGIIDDSVGKAYDYLPLRTVLGWLYSGDSESLRRHFQGKPVLLGSVLPADDRTPQTVNLAAWEDNAGLAPGVLIHAQTLRSLMNRGLIQPVSLWLSLTLIVCAALWCLAGLRATTALVVLLLWTLALFVSGLWLFRLGWFVPPSAAIATAFLALGGRTAVDASIKLKERRLLKQSFAGSVSPIVMDEILAGKLTPELGGVRKFVCILFADIRGFTTRSETMSPEAGIALLNRYFDRVVHVIHAEGGAVISFMGDGIMAIFGAPNPLVNACASGLAAAQAMQHEVARFNVALVSEGLAPIEIGVGLHAGDTVIGHMGASIRHDYTAIGDAPNVASRVEGLTKAVEYDVVCTRAVIDLLERRDDLVPLGLQPIKGHTPVEVFGWKLRSPIL